MKKAIGILLLLVGIPAAADQKEAPPQACQDEEAIVADYNKTLTELVGTVKKETLEDFRRAYHRRSTLTKLTLCTGMIDGAMSCLEQSAQDSSTPKDQAESYKTKHDAYAKLKDKVVQYRDSLKTAEMDEDAKPLIEKMEFPQ